MILYKGINPETGKILEREFHEKEEAEGYALHVIEKYPKFVITKKPITTDENEEDEYDESTILNDMGLDDEETNSGFDVNDFFENH
jgi:hypothetical protein